MGAKRRTINTRILVDAGALVFGDPDIPLPGTRIGNVPNGLHTITGYIRQIRGARFLSAIDIRICDEDGPKTSFDISIDSGILCIARSRQDLLSARRRDIRRARKKFWKSLMALPESPDFHTFFDHYNEPWATVAPLSDGIYSVLGSVRQFMKRSIAGNVG